MPEPINRNRRYMPGLDGLRAVAVIGVLAYHLDFEWMPGGFLGVSVFFTLSGYLITDLLLGQMGNGTFSVSSFWLARARRLIPAMLLMVLVVAAWVTTIGPRQGPGFAAAAGTAALYVNNWWMILRDLSYFDQFAAPGPFNHLWSLAVEEQFYLVWPLLLMGGIALIRERAPDPIRPRLASATLSLAAASAVLMMLLYEPGTDPSRVYYGTDSRAAELLVGAALAAVWPSQRLRSGITSQARTTIDVVGIAGLAVVGVFFVLAEEFTSFLYRGGFLLLSVAVAAVVASVAHPASRLGSVLGCRPMRWIGERSYGIYLWHFPIIVLTSAGALGPSPVRVALQLAATFGIAALSWRFFEDPIRHGAVGRIWARLRAGSLPRPWVAAAMLAAFVVVVPATVGFAGAGRGDSAPGNDEISIRRTVAVESESNGTSAGTESETTTGAASATRAPTEVVDALGPCTSVVHVGDSTSIGMVSRRYIPDETQQLPAQYARVGVTTQHFDIEGGRAITEGYRAQDKPPARESAQTWRDGGFDGCWVFALGTMDAANVGIGGTGYSFDDRIDIMMEIAAGDPVLWVNARTVATTGPWRAEVMSPWNQALSDACGRHPNLRIYDWASDVQDDWFEPDGIHQDETGSALRARYIADALATAFPGPGATEATPTAGDGCVFDLGGS